MGLIKGALFIFVTNILLFYVMDQYVLGESFQVIGGTWGYVSVALFFGVVNFFLKPILNIITLPLRMITLGGISVLLNAALLWISQKGVNLFENFGVMVQVDGLTAYLILGLLLAMGNSMTHWFVK